MEEYASEKAKGTSTYNQYEDHTKYEADLKEPSLYIGK